jgi:hypothetical protein
MAAKTKTKAQWRDATGYSAGERGKAEPRSWERPFWHSRIVVTRRHGVANMWYVFCPLLNIDEGLESIGIVEALPEAEQVVREKLQRLIAEL